MKKILIFIATMALTASCGKKGQQADNQQDYNEEKVEYILRDSTVYGFCGEGSAMNTLQLITDTGDTLTVNLERCRNKDRVMGGYAVGDEMAVMVNADSTEALLVINKSVLHGDWVMASTRAASCISRGDCSTANCRYRPPARTASTWRSFRYLAL